MSHACVCCTGHLSLLLLSADDGRSTLVDLTKTLAEMAQHGQLAPRDISQELLHDELTTSVMDEPDLLMVFSPVIQLQGYPPWQLRLTEIFHEEDRTGVEYLIWLKGLYNYAKAQMRFGRLDKADRAGWQGKGGLVSWGPRQVTSPSRVAVSASFGGSFSHGVFHMGWYGMLQGKLIQRPRSPDPIIC